MVAGPERISAVHSRIADIHARIAGGATPLAGGVAGATTSAIPATSPSSFADVLATVQQGGPPVPGLLGYGGASGAVAPDGDMRSAAAHRQFAADLLVALGMPQTTENIRAMVAWQQAEGTRAAFNPLATTQPSNGANDFNSVGVKNYTSYAQGIAATVKTLRNGRYGEILAALGHGNDAHGVAAAVARSPWGTGDGVARVLASGRV